MTTIAAIPALPLSPPVAPEALSSAPLRVEVVADAYEPTSSSTPLRQGSSAVARGFDGTVPVRAIFDRMVRGELSDTDLHRLFSNDNATRALARSFNASDSLSLNARAYNTLLGHVDALSPDEARRGVATFLVNGNGSNPAYTPLMEALVARAGGSAQAAPAIASELGHRPLTDFEIGTLAGGISTSVLSTAGLVAGGIVLAACATNPAGWALIGIGIALAVVALLIWALYALVQALGSIPM